MKKNLTFKSFIAIISISLLFPLNALFADGTESLGVPSIDVASGTGIISAGVGMVEESEGTMAVNIPGFTTIEQVLLYWEGQMKCNLSELCPGDDTITVNGAAIQGTLIGGPTDILSTSAAKDNYAIVTSTFRADISDRGWVQPGKNSLVVSGMDFTYANNGAGVFVIYRDGLNVSEISLRDGSDFAYWKRSDPLNSTVPQTFTFNPAGFDRIATLNMFFSSVSGSVSGSGDFRPTAVEITVNGGTDVRNNLLNSTSGDEWDSITLYDVLIPAGASELTLQAFSEDRLFLGKNPASFNWIAAGITVSSVPSYSGCTPGYWKQTQHFGSWFGYDPDMIFSDAFMGAMPTISFSEKGKPYDVIDPTLLQALQATGGGESALARHAVAALLNAANPNVYYPRNESQIIDMVQRALSGEVSIEKIKDDIAGWNELGCTATESEPVTEPDNNKKPLAYSGISLEDATVDSGAGSSGSCFISSLF